MHRNNQDSVHTIFKSSYHLLPRYLAVISGHLRNSFLLCDFARVKDARGAVLVGRGSSGQGVAVEGGEEVIRGSLT